MKEDLYVPQGVEAAKDLAIEDVHECRTGEIVDAEDALPLDDESLHERRREIEKAYQSGWPMYLCALCSKPVYLALASRSKRSGLHFRHYIDDGDCIARTRNGKTKEQIEAQKYDGLKEGPLHLETKELLMASLKADPDFSGVDAEKRWTSKDGTQWRRPDVRALFRGQPVAFEIQLATTFLSVIESRSRFYLSEGARLIWVFRSFQTENRPAAIDDIYFGNNRNAFVVSPATRDASKEAGRMMMFCHWPQPELRGEEIAEVWKEQLVAFSDVKADAVGREWFFDCNRERRTLHLKVLKQRVRAYCTGYEAFELEERDARWEDLVRHAGTLKFPLGDRHAETRFRKLMSALLSLEEGKPVGFGFSALVSVAHHIYDKHKPLLYYFLYAENAYARREQLLKAGKPGVWEKRRTDARKEMKPGGLCEPDKTHDELVQLLFPDVGALIEKRRKQQQPPATE